MKISKYIFFYLLGILILIQACDPVVTETTIDPELPQNPFDDIVYPEPPTGTEMIDSNSFLGIHHFILKPSCALPGCHDGTNEPDYRYFQAAYDNLVYYPVKNNTPNEDYDYRVVPSDPAASMLFHRVTQNSPTLEQMPSSGNPLPQNEIKMIENWINGGAKDVFGNVPALTSLQPSCGGVVAYLPNSGNFRVDTIRGNAFFNPFPAQPTDDLELWFLCYDTDVNGNYTFGNTLTYNKIKLSTNPFDFSNAVQLDLSMGFKLINSVFSQYDPTAFPHYQTVTFKPSTHGFTSGQTVYMRVYVQDSDHNFPTEIPQDDSQFAIQSYFSFVLQ